MDSRYASKKTTFTVLTVPRALSRIHRNGKSIPGGPVDWDMNPLQENALTIAVNAAKRTRNS